MPTEILCAICDDPTGSDGNAICASCANELEGVDLPICGICNEPNYLNDLFDYLGHLICMGCAP